MSSRMGSCLQHLHFLGSMLRFLFLKVMSRHMRRSQCRMQWSMLWSSTVTLPLIRFHSSQSSSASSYAGNCSVSRASGWWVNGHGDALLARQRISGTLDRRGRPVRTGFLDDLRCFRAKYDDGMYCALESSPRWSGCMQSASATFARR